MRYIEGEREGILLVANDRRGTFGMRSEIAMEHRDAVNERSTIAGCAFGMRSEIAMVHRDAVNDRRGNGIRGNATCHCSHFLSKLIFVALRAPLHFARDDSRVGYGGLDGD